MGFVSDCLAEVKQDDIDNAVALERSKMSKELEELKARLLSCATVNNRILHGASVSVMDIQLAQMAIEFNNSIIQELGESEDGSEEESKLEDTDDVSDSAMVPPVIE